MCSGRYVCSKCVDHAETSSLASPPQPPLQLPAQVSRSIQKVPRSLQLQRESDVEGTPSSSRLWQGIHVEGLRFQGGWGRPMQIQSDDGLIHWPTTHDRQLHS